MSIDGTSEPGAPSGNTTGSQLPWHLIPHFSPGETDLTEYARRLEFLAGIWPSEYLNQLAPRAAFAVQRISLSKGRTFGPCEVEGEQLRWSQTPCDHTWRSVGKDGP